MKINHSSPPTGGSVSALSSVGTSQTKTVARTVTTELQSAPARRALAAATEVDMAKVQQVKQAIAEGRLALDPQALAEAVLGLHRS